MKTSITPKPKQPLTAYNIFFVLERKRIVREELNENDPPYYTARDARDVCVEYKKRTGRRAHRKSSHGKIGFAELAVAVGARWKRVDSKTLRILLHQAALEKDEHMRLLHAWKESKKSEKKEDETSHDERCAPEVLPKVLPSALESPRPLCTQLPKNASMPLDNACNYSYPNAIFTPETPLFSQPEQLQYKHEDLIVSSMSTIHHFHKKKSDCWDAKVDLLTPIHPDDMDKLFDD